MWLIIPIPSHHEAGALPETWHARPRRIKGLTRTEHLAVDDGSTDDTARVGLHLWIGSIARPWRRLAGADRGLDHSF